MKILRVKAGLNQKALATSIGVSRETIINWETGKTEPQLTIAQFKALLHALKIGIEELPDSFAPTSTSDHEKSEG